MYVFHSFEQFIKYDEKIKTNILYSNCVITKSADEKPETFVRIIEV